MKNSAIILIIISAWFIQACSESSGKTKTRFAAGETIPVRIIELQKRNIQIPIHASGQFTTDDETNLSFKTGGVIDRIFVKEGDRVKRGQLLATLNLTEINAQVSQAKLGYEKAVRDFQRVSNLYRDSVATLEQFQNAETGLSIASQQFEAAKFNQTFSEIRSVSDGFVLKKQANAGQVISPGTTVLTTNGAGSGKWLLKIGVSDKDWARIQLNDVAEVYTDASSGKPFKGKVSKKSEGTDSYTGSFTVEIALEQSKSSFATGMFGKATITPSQSVSSWVIPYDALLDGDGDAGYVFITNDLKSAQKTEVTVGGIEKDNILITAGLDGAQALIVSGGAYLKDQSPIQVIEVK
jgi:RND family efflux transporter MFP subunit